MTAPPSTSAVPRTLVVAACQYGLDRLGGWDAYAAKIADTVEEAAAAGAQLLVFPEYAALELTGWMPEAVQRSLPAQLAALPALLPPFLALHDALARQHGVWIVAGSFPVPEGDEVRNRAFVFGPAGPLGHQDKCVMTRFERETWGVAPGDALRVFDVAGAAVAVLICYDSEFPLLARAAVEAGAEVLVVPSCTDTLAGYHRVLIGCRARALENQCFVVQAPLVGTADWSEAVDVNVGAAGVFGPVDRGFPDDGVVAVGTMNAPMWLVATLALDHLHEVRATGQVLNHRDWPAQHRVRVEG